MIEESAGHVQVKYINLAVRVYGPVLIYIYIYIFAINVGVYVNLFFQRFIG